MPLHLLKTKCTLSCLAAENYTAALTEFCKIIQAIWNIAAAFMNSVELSNKLTLQDSSLCHRKAKSHPPYRGTWIQRSVPAGWSEGKSWPPPACGDSGRWRWQAEEGWCWISVWLPPESVHRSLPDHPCKPRRRRRGICGENEKPNIYFTVSYLLKSWFTEHFLYVSCPVLTGIQFNDLLIIEHSLS